MAVFKWLVIMAIFYAVLALPEIIASNISAEWGAVIFIVFAASVIAVLWKLVVYITRDWDN